MPKEVLVALIAAAVSLILAIWGLATARFNKSLVLAAEERAKRGELVRVKALGAIDSLLAAIAELMAVVGGFKFLVQYAGGVSNEVASVKESMKKFAETRADVIKLRIRFAPYLTQSVVDQIEELIASTESLDMGSLDEVEARLKSIADNMAESARARYLDHAET